MFFEYALEPAVISSWERARFFIDAFGPWKGRFLAEYPRAWKKMVYVGLNCAPVERLRIVERLQQLDKRVFSPRTNAPYDGALPWLDNAVLEDQRQPFHAIVATQARGTRVLDASEIDERHEKWRVETGKLVPRDPTLLVQALLVLLDASKRVVVIDPYFRADLDTRTRPLVALCDQVNGRAAVEVHFADEPRGYAPVMTDAARALPRVLPAGMKVTLHCWKERPGGARLHNRYVLTEIGGVQFGDSVETGDAGQQDRLSIVDEPSRLALWDQYLGTSPAFDSAGAPREFVGGSSRSYR